ncbi:hypothetical protein J5U23_01718 [Saccharolobus shibatae B12]|uniref:Uncharacterized protein n=1 Tax=Saccharolobus shibatae (strain ATCC 51178 / DSM 5389 / JCM 8931 / NBRC 15437 / B12) TaxID=523848 RepID=A0A8F5BP08_SACSH|nr:hypothetical protein J5U23_01718 [Saccharolobus shibatae B12]
MSFIISFQFYSRLSLYIAIVVVIVTLTFNSIVDYQISNADLMDMIDKTFNSIVDYLAGTSDTLRTSTCFFQFYSRLSLLKVLCHRKHFETFNSIVDYR